HPPRRPPHHADRRPQPRARRHPHAHGTPVPPHLRRGIRRDERHRGRGSVPEGLAPGAARGPGAAADRRRRRHHPGEEEAVTHLHSGPLVADFGTAGASARRQHQRLNDAHRKRRHRLRASAGFAGLLTPAVLPLGVPGLLTTSLAVATAATSWWAADRGFVQRHGKETGVSWRIGAEGEEVTAELLTPLRRQGWYWLHDRAVPTRRFNLDHLG